MPSMRAVPEDAAPVAFLVRCGEVQLKLTARGTALRKSFAKAILAPFVSAYNQREESKLMPETLEAVEVNGKRLADLSTRVDSFATASLIRVELIMPPSRSGQQPSGDGDDFDGEVDLSRLEVFVPAAGLSAVHAHASIAATSR